MLVADIAIGFLIDRDLPRHARRHRAVSVDVGQLRSTNVISRRIGTWGLAFSLADVLNRLCFAACLRRDNTPWEGNGMRKLRLGLLAPALATFLIMVGLSASANAGTLRQGSTGGGSTVTGSLPGQVMWTYYQTINGDTAYAQVCPPSDGSGAEDALCNNAGIGDNIIRLINPNGSANPFLAGGIEHPVCAMIYVFDDDEEMGECCGCPLSLDQAGDFFG